MQVSSVPLLREEEKNAEVSEIHPNTVEKANLCMEKFKKTCIKLWDGTCFLGGLSLMGGSVILMGKLCGTDAQAAGFGFFFLGGVIAQHNWNKLTS